MRTLRLSLLQDSSGLVISIITVIARVSSGGLVIGIQSFYPEKERQVGHLAQALANLLLIRWRPVVKSSLGRGGCPVLRPPAV